jgi:hypothetical protein
MRSMTTNRYSMVAAPRVGLSLLLILLAHVIFIASPLHMAMLSGDRYHQIVTAEGHGEDQQQISANGQPHLDCLIQWTRSPQAPWFGLLLLLGSVVAWMSGLISSIQTMRPLPQANGPPRGDRQALLQVFRL